MIYLVRTGILAGLIVIRFRLKVSRRKVGRLFLFKGDFIIFKKISLTTISMTPRTFWAILIKILGLYIILDSLPGIPGFLNSLISYKALVNATGTYQLAFFQLMYYVTVIIVYGFMCWLCLFNTNLLIDKLKLDQGYQDERFDFTMHRSNVLKIAVMAIGGLMVTNGFPLLCKYAFGYFEQIDQNRRFTESQQATLIIVYFLQTIIGYFLLTCSRMVVNYIELKRRKTIANIIEE